MTTKQHWETVYKTKSPQEVSWTQEIPETSLQLIQEANLPKTAKIIDVGGGDSKLVDNLLDAGYHDITVLDISANAIENAQKRLGPKAKMVQWIVADVFAFKPTRVYDLWHDRAAFHFLTSDAEVQHYRYLTHNFISDRLILGTFSTQGPTKCSGLEITQYDDQSLTKIFEDRFIKTRCLSTDHRTPFGTLQNFLFCSYKKK